MAHLAAGQRVRSVSLGGRTSRLAGACLTIAIAADSQDRGIRIWRSSRNQAASHRI